MFISIVIIVAAHLPFQFRTNLIPFAWKSSFPLLNGCELLPAPENLMHSPTTGLLMTSSSHKQEPVARLTLYTSRADGLSLGLF